MNITDKTKIPLFSAIGAVSVLMGLSFWLSMVSASAANAVQVNAIQDQKIEMIYQIKEDVAVIKKLLETKGH